MIATNSSLSEQLDIESIRQILRTSGPCLTMLMPPYRPGEQAASPGTLLKSNIQLAAKQLGEHTSKNGGFLQPLQRLTEDPVFNSGSHESQAIFLSPEFFRHFQLTDTVDASTTVAGSFLIRPLIPELWRPRVFYILALSKIEAALMRCSGLHAEIVELPPEASKLTEALELERPDHDLENRHTASGAREAHNVRFGTGTEQEKERVHLAEFYRQVDRGLQKYLRGPDVPLILAGVEEDTAIYRAVNTHRNLLPVKIEGKRNPSRDPADLLQRAHSILRQDGFETWQKALFTARERTAPGRLATDTDAILNAAFEGRVNQLFVSGAPDRTGVFERGTYRSHGKEDLLNLAMARTILDGGEAYTLPAAMMPDGLDAIAILRF